MNLPMVMPANRFTIGLPINKDFPGRIGLIFSPDSWVNPRGLPYVLDNGRYSAWNKGKKWDENLYIKLLDRAKCADYSPLWIAVPDYVADADGTFREWDRWNKPLSRLGWPLALVVQDGMTVEQVKSVRPQPEVIFVGGTTKWKWRTLRIWTKQFPRVHVGRVNTSRMLWWVHHSGAESSDGSGWWHKKQRKQLVEYLNRSSRGLNRRDTATFGFSDRRKQCSK